MFLIIFSLILLIVNIYCFINKKYLNIFIPCILFLPDYYGIEISNNMPVMTVTRIMFIIFYVYTFLNRKKELSIRVLFKTMPKECYLFLMYFILRIISNLYYITTYSQAVKSIFAIIFEQLGFIIAIYLLQPNKEEIHSIIKAVVLGATILFIVGIIESYTFIRPFDALYTVNRHMLNDHLVRLGLLRATTTMGLPVLYGNMCVLLLPLILYLYSESKNNKYLVVIVLDILATVHSGSRADIIFLVAILFLYFLFCIFYNRENIKLVVKNSLVVCGATMIIIVFLCGSSPYSKYYYEGTAKSVLNEFGFSFNVEESAPNGVDGYGVNKHGVSSRTFQISGIRYALSKNTLFGLGTGALESGEVYYNGGGYWKAYYTYDMGLVEVLISEGIVGFLGYLSIIIFLMFVTMKQLSTLRTNTRNISILLLPFVYLLSTLSTANMHNFLLFIVGIYIMFFYNHEKTEIYC